jgi:hypothetical protein
MKLITIYARTYLDIASRLELILQKIPEPGDLTVMQANPLPVAQDLVNFAVGTLKVIKEKCEQCEFPVTGDLTDRTMKQLILGGFSNEQQLRARFDCIASALNSEVHQSTLVQIPSVQKNFYQAKDLFGPLVSGKFPSVLLDIEEAGSCFALDRNTACVFHLMRAMEVGLRALGKSLNNPNLDPKRNPNWEAILKPCDDELRKPLKERANEWRSDELFFSNATANLRAVKDAWRNPTLHVEMNYDDDRALEIFNAVKAFMRHLAGKLSE